jgi:branched-chain amino acid aminotransferase
MGLCIYLNGRYLDRREDALVSIYDHGFLYGDGIFEGIRGYSGRIFRLDEHVERLYQSARGIHMEIPVPPEEMRALVVETCRRTGEENLYIRLIVSRGIGDMGIDPRKCTQGAGIFIIAGGIQLYPEEKYETGLRVVTVATRRNRPDIFPAQIKSLNYLNNILGKIEANRLGADEGVMLDTDGYVTEATADNLFIVRRGELFTPAPHYSMLVGITRNAVIELARQQGVPVHECGMVLHDLAVADEFFLTGSGAELIPVVDFDDHPVGDGKPGPVFRGLLKAFRELTRTEGVPYLEPAGSSTQG